MVSEKLISAIPTFLIGWKYPHEREWEGAWNHKNTKAEKIKVRSNISYHTLILLNVYCFFIKGNTFVLCWIWMYSSIIRHITEGRSLEKKGLPAWFTMQMYI